MSFKSYLRCPQLEGLALLEDPQPLVFSGKHGLIARQVLGREQPNQQWRITPQALHELAGLPSQNRVIVFGQKQDDQIELLLLKSVDGFSAERTEMMFRFSPLVLVNSTPRYVVKEPTMQKIYTEELVLDGGVLAPAANWRWRKPHLALGGVICGTNAQNTAT